MHIHELCEGGGSLRRIYTNVGKLSETNFGYLTNGDHPAQACPDMIQTCPDMSEERGGVTEPEIAKVLEIVLEVF